MPGSGTLTKMVQEKFDGYRIKCGIQLNVENLNFISEIGENVLTAETLNVISSSIFKEKVEVFNV